MSSLEERVEALEARCDSLQVQILAEAEKRAHTDEVADMALTRGWKMLLFRCNGWPRKPVPASEQAWRPWHHWLGRRDR